MEDLVKNGTKRCYHADSKKMYVSHETLEWKYMNCQVNVHIEIMYNTICSSHHEDTFQHK